MTTTLASGLSMGLVLVLASSTAFAQAPTPSPAPTGPDAKTEKVGKDESLQHGGDARPWAAGVSTENQRGALEKFREGNAKLNDGLFKDAVTKYREALKFWDHPAIHYNLALALLNLDQPLEVHDSLQKAIKFGPEPLEKEKFDHANKYLHLVEQQIAWIEITCKKPGAKVSVDGKEIFTVGPNGEGGFHRGRVRIGKHAFIAEKPGYNAEAEVPFIGPGETFRLELKLYTADELTRHRRKWDATWMPYAVIGGGVAAGILGGVFTLSANSSYEDFDAEVARCNTSSMGMGCDAAMVQNLRDSGDTKRTLGYVGYGVAGGAIVTGLILAFLNREESYQITADDLRREQRAKASGTVTVTPLVAPNAGGAMIFGSF